MNKEYLIKKWLADELTEAELKAFRDLEDYNSHIRILEGAQQFKASEVSEVADLDSFYARMNSKKDAQDDKVRTISWYKPFLQAAASVAIVLGVASFFFFFNNNEVISTAIGEKMSVELPSASEVTLNAQSSISYNTDTWGKNREITLEGEAFFKVSKGRRFDVVTSEGIITVLGTQFNVKNRSGYFEVTCLEGMVSLVYGEGTTRNIAAGTAFRIVGGTALFERKEVAFPSWMHNKSTFDTVPYTEVLQEFQRQYNVTFSTENIDTQRIFTGGFVHNSLEDGLKSITLPLDLTYSIDTSGTIITLQKSER